MLTKFVQTFHKAKFLLDDHSTTILTAAGVGGTVATAVLTGHASFKAAEIIKEKEKELEVTVDTVHNGNLIQELTTAGKVKLVWKQYLPPVAVGITTVTSIIVANKISSKKIAALAVAGGISERALQEYKEKVVEKFGESKNRAIRDEIAQDRVSKDPSSSQIVIVGSGDVLCYDSLTGRYFQSSVEKIKGAENKINYEILNNMGASLSEFFDELGLQATTYTDSVGWSGDRVEVYLSTVMSPDNRPCISIDFNKPPVLEYGRYWS